MVAQTLKTLDFFTKEICPYYCCFLHTKKDSGGASIHRINKSFPLKPSLMDPKPHVIWWTLDVSYHHQKFFMWIDGLKQIWDRIWNLVSFEWSQNLMCFDGPIFVFSFLEILCLLLDPKTSCHSVDPQPKGSIKRNESLNLGSTVEILSYQISIYPWCVENL